METCVNPQNDIKPYYLWMTHQEKNKKEVGKKMIDVKKLREIMNERKITRHKLSQMSGVDEAELSHLFNERIKSPLLITVIKIADALKISLDDIVIREYRG